MILALKRGVQEKQAAETRTKGVVGQIGSSSPMAPIPRKKKPSPVSSIIFTRNEPPPWTCFLLISE